MKYKPYFLFLFTIILSTPVFSMLSQKATGILNFEGEIDKDAYTKIQSFVKSGGRKIVVNSHGGDVFYGQKIAFEILNKDITVIVDRYCFSSCANYLFLGATTKIMRDGAILGFHGGASLNNPQNNVKSRGKLQNNLENLANREKELFRELHVNYQLIQSSFALTKSKEDLIIVEIDDDPKLRRIFSQDERVKAATYVADYLETSPDAKWNIKLINLGASIGVYFPSKETLLRHGVKGIRQYPYPKNKNHLNALAKMIADDLIVIGDYKDMK